MVVFSPPFNDSNNNKNKNKENNKNNITKLLLLSVPQTWNSIRIMSELNISKTGGFHTP